MTPSSVSFRPSKHHFVGRGAELSTVARLLESGERMASFVVIDGESGIGKTRLLTELAARARARSMTVLRGCATESGTSLPLSLVYDLVGEVRGEPAPSGSDGLDNPATVLDWLDRTGGRDRPAGGDQPLGVERYRLYHALAAWLESLGPALVLLDDCQWADDASTELLDYLARHPPRGPIVFVLAYRAGNGSLRLRRSLGQVRPPVTRLALNPLSMADVDEWLSTESPSRRRRLYEASCGNPLYLEILAEAGDDRTLLELGRAPSVIDDRVAVALDRMIRSDLRGLPEPQRLIATAAAVVGEDIDPAFVATVADLDVPAAIEALDALVARDVLRQAGTQLTFRHPLVRAAAYRLAGPAWRFAAHARAAARLADAGAPAVRRAQHLEHAAVIGDVAAATVLAEAAAAELETAPSGSARWLHAALRSLPDRPDTEDLRTRLRLMLARALTMCGRLGESRELLHALLAGGTRCRHDALELLAATERLMGRLPQARQLLQEELGRTGHDVDEAAIRLQLAATEVLDGQVAESERHASAVLALCADGARPDLAAAATTLLALIRVLGGSPAEAGAQLAHAQWVVDGLDDVALRGMLDLISPLAWVELMAERYDDAMRHLDRGIAVARRYGRNHVMPDLYLVRSVAAGRVGQIGAAVRDAEDAEEMALLVGGMELRRLAAVMRLRPSLWRDGPAQARPLLDRIRSFQPLRSRWWRSAAATTIAEVALELGDPQLCRSLLSHHTGPEAPATGTPATLRLLTRAELLSGNVASAAALFERASVAAADSGLRGEMSATALVEAELRAAERRMGEAIDAAARAVLEANIAGLPVREGQARVVLGELHHRVGDLSAGRSELGAARDLFAGSGADWLAGQTTGALRRLAAGRARTGPRAQAGRVLSAREREVAVMVAEGLTNRAIADRLYLSPRTVDAHLARIFAKFGVSTRGALVRLLGDPTAPADGRPEAGN